MKELLKKEIKDLEKLLTEKRTSLKSFRFGLAGSKVTNLKEGRNIRKEIARILTAIKIKDTFNK